MRIDNMHTEMTHYLYYKVDIGGDFIYAKIGIHGTSKPMEDEAKELAIQGGREALAKLAKVDIAAVEPVTKQEYDDNTDDDEDYDDEEDRD